jgi:replicative DNA helicase Mcm
MTTSFQSVLESAEIVDMRDGSRQLAVNGRRSGHFIGLNFKSAELKLKVVIERLKELCGRDGIDTGSEHKLEEVVKKAFADYVNNGRKGHQRGNGNGRGKKGQKTTIATTSKEQQRIIPVSEALRAQHEESYKVYGMISSLSPVFRMVTGQTYSCSLCEREKFVEFGMPLVHPSPKYITCSVCEKKMEPGDCEFITALNVELMDADSFSDIERLTVTLFEENTEGVHIGERVVVEGDLHITQNGGRHSKFLPILHADSIRYEARDEVKLTDSDVDAIKRFVKLKGEDKLIESLAKMHAPDIIGHTFVKEGMLYVAAYSDYDAGGRERIRINAMLVGPAGLAKTKILRATVKLVPNSRYESGQHSSGKSLTAMIAKEDEMHILRLGPVPLARGAIVAINEAGRMSEDDQAMLLDAMEEGFFHMNKYGFNVKIRADASVIMSANPRNTNWINIGYDDKVNLNEIPALKELLDRTDLIFAVKAVRDESELRKYAEQKSEMEDRVVPNYELFLRKYIAYAKTINPVISEEAKNILNEAYVQYAQRSGTPRVRNTLFRIIRAKARLKLKPIADETDAKETISYFNTMIQQFTDVMTVPESPHDVAYRIMVDILRNSKLAILLSDLSRRASEQDQQVAAYLKGGRDIGSNRKLRRLHQSLINHSQIKQVQDRPIALQWFDGTGINSNLSDVSDVSDTQKSVDEKNNFDNLAQNNSAAQTKISASERSERSDRKQKQEAKPPLTYFACPLYPSCEEQLKGPVKLLEHIREHCPEREADTRWLLQMRGLLPEDNEEGPQLS